MPRSRASKSAVPRTVAARDVGALLASLDHPHMPAILAVRAAILSTDPAIQETVKWNAPSYSLAEHFATFHLRHRDGVLVVLHLGAKPRPDARVQERVTDPARLLEWRGPNRATVTFADVADAEAKRPAFVAVLKQWLTFVA